MIQVVKGSKEALGLKLGPIRDLRLAPSWLEFLHIYFTDFFAVFRTGISFRALKFFGKLTNLSLISVAIPSLL